MKNVRTGGVGAVHGPDDKNEPLHYNEGHGKGQAASSMHVFHLSHGNLKRGNGSCSLQVIFTVKTDYAWVRRNFVCQKIKKSTNLAFF